MKDRRYGKLTWSTSTEDRKEKEAGSGGGRVKEGSESTLGCEGSAQRRCEQIWGKGRGSGRLGEAAPHRGMGKCRGHGEMPKAFRMRRQGSRVRMRGVRAETEQEEPGGTPVRGGGGGQICLRF